MKTDRQENQKNGDKDAGEFEAYQPSFNCAT
jgi:hypothetical protein